jgi:hypothetical protein
MTTTSQLLDDAADIRERCGHIKRALSSPFGYCAVGAMRQAALNRGILKLYANRAEFVLHTHLNAGNAQLVSVPYWNDQPERTSAEVIATLRAVAAIEKARHAAEHVEHTTTTATPLPALV